MSEATGTPSTGGAVAQRRSRALLLHQPRHHAACHQRDDGGHHHAGHGARHRRRRVRRLVASPSMRSARSSPAPPPGGWSASCRCAATWWSRHCCSWRAASSARSRPTMTWFLAGRLLEGFGGGGLVALAFVSVERLFPRSIWPQLFAIMSAIWGVAAFAGPLLGRARRRISVLALGLRRLRRWAASPWRWRASSSCAGGAHGRATSRRQASAFPLRGAAVPRCRASS